MLLINFIILGDLSRCFTTKELPRILSNIQILGAISTMLAPSSIVLFTNVDFHIFGLHVNQYNFIGIVMASVMTLFAIACLKYLTNLTKHPGYNIYLTKIKRWTMNNNIEQHENQVKDKKMKGDNEVLMNIDIALAMVASLLCGIVFTESEVTINLVSMFIFQWNLSFLGLISLCSAFTATIFMKLLQRFKGMVNIYFLLIMALVINSLTVCLQMLTIQARFQALFVQVFTISTFFLINAVSGYNSTSWVRYILFSLVPPEMASTVDGYRFLCSKIGLTLGFFTASYIFRDGFFGYLSINIFCLVIYFGLLIRKKHVLSKSKCR